VQQLDKFDFKWLSARLSEVDHWSEPYAKVNGGSCRAGHFSSSIAVLSRQG
jgi:hypothetical protein